MQIVVSGNMRDDTAMNSDIFLASMTMDDCRADRTGITRLLDKKGEVLQQGLNLLDVKYCKAADGNQIGFHSIHHLSSKQFRCITPVSNLADIKMRPFFFCVCPEFLGALLQFFAPPPSAAAAEAQPPESALVHTARHRRSVALADQGSF